MTFGFKAEVVDSLLSFVFPVICDHSQEDPGSDDFRKNIRYLT